MGPERVQLVEVITDPHESFIDTIGYATSNIRIVIVNVYIFIDITMTGVDIETPAFYWRFYRWFETNAERQDI